ncbi:hypothetical protein MT418_001480 [Batrachochytrium dendrobatidis]
MSSGRLGHSVSEGVKESEAQHDSAFSSFKTRMPDLELNQTADERIERFKHQLLMDMGNATFTKSAPRLEHNAFSTEQSRPQLEALSSPLLRSVSFHTQQQPIHYQASQQSLPGQPMQPLPSNAKPEDGETKQQPVLLQQAHHPLQQQHTQYFQQQHAYSRPLPMLPGHAIQPSSIAHPYQPPPPFQMHSSSTAENGPPISIHPQQRPLPLPPRPIVPIGRPPQNQMMGYPQYQQFLQYQHANNSAGNIINVYHQPGQLPPRPFPPTFTQLQQLNHMPGGQYIRVAPPAYTTAMSHGHLVQSPAMANVGGGFLPPMHPPSFRPVVDLAYVPEPFLDSHPTPVFQSALDSSVDSNSDISASRSILNTKPIPSLPQSQVQSNNTVITKQVVDSNSNQILPAEKQQASISFTTTPVQLQSSLASTYSNMPPSSSQQHESVFPKVAPENTVLAIKSTALFSSDAVVPPVNSLAAGLSDVSLAPSPHISAFIARSGSSVSIASMASSHSGASYNISTPNSPDLRTVSCLSKAIDQKQLEEEDANVYQPVEPDYASAETRQHMFHITSGSSSTAGSPMGFALSMSPASSSLAATGPGSFHSQWQPQNVHNGRSMSPLRGSVPSPAMKTGSVDSQTYGASPDSAVMAKKSFEDALKRPTGSGLSSPAHALLPGIEPDLHAFIGSPLTRRHSSVRRGGLTSRLRTTTSNQVLPTIPRKVNPPLQDEATGVFLDKFPSISMLLQHRAHHAVGAHALALTMLDPAGKDSVSISFDKLYLKALRVAEVLHRKLYSSSLTGQFDDVAPVALLYKRSDWIDFLIAMFGCMLVGVVAVPIVTSSVNNAEELAELEFILESSKIEMCLTTDTNVRVLTKLYSQRGGAIPRLEWLKTNELGAYSAQRESASTDRKQSTGESSSTESIEDPTWLLKLTDTTSDRIAYIEYVKNSYGEYKGVAVHHGMIMAQCSAVKIAYDLQFSDVIGVCLEPRQHVGLLFSGFANIYAGCASVLFSESAICTYGLWPKCITKKKVSLFVTDMGWTYELIASNKSAKPTTETLSNMSALKKYIINSETLLPGIAAAISSTLQPFGFPGPGVVASLFTLNEFGGSIVSMDNITQASFMEHTLRLSSIRSHRFEFLYNQSGAEVPDSIRVCDSGVVMPQGSVAIIDDETDTLALNGCIGEIWISGPHIPKTLQNLPKLTEHVLQGRPMLFASPNDVFPESLGVKPIKSSQSNELNVSDKCATESVISHNHIRTGLYGFLLTRKQVPSLPDLEPRIIVLGKAGGIIFQRTVDIPRMPVHPLASTKPPPPLQTKDDNSKMSSSQKEYSFHLASQLGNTVALYVPGVIATVFFDILLHGEFLPVVLVETHREDVDMIGPHIYQILSEMYDLHVFCVSVCYPGSLPRMYADTHTGSGFQTSFIGFDAPAVMRVAPGSPFSTTVKIGYDNTLCLQKTINVDVESSRKLFHSGSLNPLFVYFNGSPRVYGHILQSPIPVSHQLTNTESNTLQIVGAMKDAPILDDRFKKDLRSFKSVLELLMWRTEITPENMAFTAVDMRGRETKIVTFAKLSTKIHALAKHLVTKANLSSGDHVLLICTHTLEYHIAVWACLYAGIVCIPIHPPDPTRLKEDIPVLLRLVDEFKVKQVLVNGPVEQDFKSKAIRTLIRTMRGPMINSSQYSIFPDICNVSKASKTNKHMSINDTAYQPRTHSKNAAAVVLVSFNPDMQYTCVKISHKTLMEQCRIQVTQSKMLRSTLYSNNSSGQISSDRYSPPTSRPLVSCLRACNGIGFTYSLLLGVYTGAGTYIISPFDYFVNPQIWFDAIHKYKVKDVFASYSMTAHAVNAMRTGLLRPFSLHNLENLMIPLDGRPQPHMFQAISGTFAPSKLSDQSISNVYTPIFNPLVSSRSYMAVDQTTLWLDSSELRNGCIKVVKELRGRHDLATELNSTAVSISDTIMVQDCGVIVNNTVVAIVDPITKQLCKPNRIGEIWVSSPGTIDGITGSEAANGAHNGRPAGLFDCVIPGIDPGLKFTRTCDRGFLWPVPVSALEAQALAIGDEPASGWDGLVNTGLPYELVLFTLGPFVDEIVVDGLIHYPEDIEATIERWSVASTIDGCMVFKSQNQVIAAVECVNLQMALNMAPQIMLAVLAKHRFLLSLIVFVPLTLLAKSRHNEKQRGRVATAFQIGKLPAMATIHISPTSNKA